MYTHTRKPPQSKPTAVKRDQDGFAKPAPIKKKSFHKPKFSKDDDSQVDDNESSLKYRDRAKERRDGTNNDYAASEAMLAILEASKQSEGSAVHTAQQTPGLVTSVDQAKLLREQTKYLGGDVGHTHLVRGLDKALLDKVRKDIGQTEEQKLK